MIGVATALLVLPIGARPAAAKGPESVTISGPGLDEPIEVDLAAHGAGNDTPSYLVVALVEIASPYDLTSRAPQLESTPSGRLNDRYTLTWTMSHPSDADPDSFTVVQDVYPDAAFGGPYIHVRPHDNIDADGWYAPHPALRDTLAALGVPLTTPTAQASAAPPDDETTTGWPLPLATATALAAGTAFGTLLTRRRSRTTPRHATA